MSLTVGVDYFRGYDRIILNLINLELLRANFVGNIVYEDEFQVAVQLD